MASIKALTTLWFLATFAGCATISEFLGIPYGDPEVATSIPSRPSGALTGGQIAAKLSQATLYEREEIILNEALRGNIPDYLRNLRPIDVSGKRKDGTPVKATIWVMPDYLALGSNSDFLRLPMTPMTAQKVSDKFGFVLPTRKLVNDIYRSAGVKLKPSPMKASHEMVSIEYYMKHHSNIEKQLRGQSKTQLIAGHKKDIVNTPQLQARPMQVAIYGWHRGIGDPIQPLSLVHINSYADYSHGVRMVRDIMMVDGKKMSIRQVMRDPQLSTLISDEGPIQNSRVPIQPHPRLMGKPNS